ncbi:MAG TPA: gamma-glutamyltransferase [Gammaproteobacteria bacterium]|nr:gamma-glutamyltransferase [Gammaproteobacteria bacterium]
MSKAIGIAGPSGIAVRAGAEVAEAGGNAVDAAVAATLAALCTEVAIVAPDAAAYVTLWRPGEPPVVIDGGIVMPGLDRPAERFGCGAPRAVVEYGGGLETLVGYGAVGVGGAIAAIGDASARWGSCDWAALVAPALAHARDGFPLSRASHTWLCYSHREIFGWQPESAAVIHDARGELLPPGGTVRIPGLADSLAELAREGPSVFYSGRLGDAIADCIDVGGGLMGRADRRAYRALEHSPVTCDLDGWQIAVPPPPAIGGATLAAMLARMGPEPARQWTPAAVATLAAAQRDVLEFVQALPACEDADGFLATLLNWARAGGDPRGHRSPSTVHVSAMDEDGLACAITASSGYGSGVLVPGAGIWLNNCLGELELNPRGFHGMAPGERMASNMSPAVARRLDGAALSLGSPGAERITTALLQVMLNFMRLGGSLEDALAAPRLHVERAGKGWQAAVEPGLPLDALDMPCRVFDGLSMFFGGAGAVLRRADGMLVAAADPRRQGAAVVVPAGPR